MKTSIIFHSVTGNTYLMAKKFYQEFKKHNQDVALYRVKDPDFSEQPDWTPRAKEILMEMMKHPTATSKTLLDSDLIIIGCPTYFGNISADMKHFIDEEAGGLWAEAKLAGKKMAVFTSVGSQEGGGEQCLSMLQIFSNMMGTSLIPVPANLLEGLYVTFTGVMHFSYLQYANELDEKTSKTIEKYTETLINR